MVNPFDNPVAPTKKRKAATKKKATKAGGTPPSSLSTFESRYSPLIEKELEKSVSGLDNKEAVMKALQGGKRLRAKLAVLTYRACGGTDDGQAVKTAVAAETSHAASLLKDDILDKDKTRRGATSAWVERGPMEAMRTADTMVITGLEALVDFPANLVKTFLGGWKQAWQGESEDYSIISEMSKVNGPFYDMYYRVIKRKTASLFATAAKLGAEAANASPENAAKVYQYGEDVGILYQLADDAVDFKKGKFELLPSLALAQFDQTLKAQILGALSQGRANIGETLMGFGINLEQFLQSELKVRLKKLADDAAGKFEFCDPKYRSLMAEFPQAAVKAMLAEGKMESFLD